jgi:hypothetical protein
MPMSSNTSVTLQIVAGPDSDDEELDGMTDDLRDLLLQIDVQDVKRLPAGEVPHGTKASDAVATGMLLVTMAPTLLPSAVTLLQAWLASRPVQSIKVTLGDDSIEVTDPSRDDQRQLIEAFLQRNQG